MTYWAPIRTPASTRKSSQPQMEFGFLTFSRILWTPWSTSWDLAASLARARSSDAVVTGSRSVSVERWWASIFRTCNRDAVLPAGTLSCAPHEAQTTAPLDAYSETLFSTPQALHLTRMSDMSAAAFYRCKPTPRHPY